MKVAGILAMLLVLALVVFIDGGGAQTQAPASKSGAEPKADAAKGAGAGKESGAKEAKAPAAKSTAWKIQNAMSAAPASISKNATIMDWPAKEGEEPKVLRKGTNEWTCFPDSPASPGNDPMCLDKVWMAWLQGYITKKAPQITAPGLGYMLAGGSTASNSDPFATQPPPGEKWMKEQPHVMVLLPGKLDAKAHSSDPHSGGPWIMWGGTPYEHIMVPVK